MTYFKSPRVLCSSVSSIIIKIKQCVGVWKRENKSIPSDILFPYSQTQLHIIKSIFSPVITALSQRRIIYHNLQPVNVTSFIWVTLHDISCQSSVSESIWTFVRLRWCLAVRRSSVCFPSQINCPLAFAWSPWVCVHSTKLVTSVQNRKKIPNNSEFFFIKSYDE